MTIDMIALRKAAKAAAAEPKAKPGEGTYMTQANLYDITGDIKDINTLLVQKQALDTIEKDAARYRWLRHGDNDETVLCENCRGVYLPRNERLDEAIDKQIDMEQRNTVCLQEVDRTEIVRELSIKIATEIESLK